MTEWYERNIRLLSLNPFYTSLINKLEEVEPEGLLLPPDFNSDQYIEATMQHNGVNDLDELRSVVIFGFEKGIIIDYLLKKCSDATSFIIMDTNLNHIKYTLIHHNCEVFILNPRITLAFSEEKNLKKNLEASFFNTFSSLLSNRIHYVDQLIYKVIDPDYTNQLKQQFILARQGFLNILGNSADDTLKAFKNIFQNIKYITGSFPLETLITKYKNKPAICVAAGPSLEKNISFLKQMQDNVLIISCDTIAERLIKEGIRIDIVSSMERGEEVYESFYRGKTFDESTMFVGLSLVDSRIFEEFPGPKAVVSPLGMPFDNWLKDTIPNMIFMNSGRSVAHLNYSLAVFFGCEPIILIGQDLAYGVKGHSHATGTYEVNTFFQDKPELLTHNWEPRFEVPGFYGEPVLTNRWWDMFRKWFEDIIPTNLNKVINATEGGSYIRGADHMALQTVFKTYCISKLNVKMDRLEVYNKTYDQYVPMAKTLSKRANVLIETNKKEIENLHKLLKELKWLLNEKRWIKSNVRVLNKIGTIDQEIMRIIGEDSNLKITVQYNNFMYKSKINRLVELKDFSDVLLVYDYLKEFIVNVIHYSEKIEELYVFLDSEIKKMVLEFEYELLH